MCFFPGYPTKENVAKQLRWKKWNPNQHGPMKIHELSLLATSSFWTPRSKAQWLHGSSRLTKTWLLAGVHFSRGYCSPSLHPEAATEQRGFSTMFTFIARSLFSTLEIHNTCPHLQQHAASCARHPEISECMLQVGSLSWTSPSEPVQFAWLKFDQSKAKALCHSFLGPKHSLQSAFHRINSINRMNGQCDVNCLQPPLPESGAQKGIEMGSMPMTSIMIK